MGTDERPPDAGVIRQLMAEPQGFDLFQAISLLERAAHERGHAGTQQRIPVRFRAVVSLAFQPSDISKVSDGAADAAVYTLHSPVMTLAGANGPLPLPFTEMVMERSAQRDHAMADFLDIFNHRFLNFLYRSRKKHHVGLNGLAPHKSPLAASLDALSALGLKAGARAHSGEASWLEHAGLMGAAPRSMSGLVALLSSRFGVRVRGRQFCGGWRQLEETDVVRLGARGRQHAARLGHSAVLGRKVWDQSAGISIEFSGLKMARLQRLLKGGPDHALLHWLVRRYLAQDLDVEMVLQIDPAEVQPTELRQQSGLRLGLTSWLHSSKPPPGREIAARFRLDDEAPCAI